MLTLRKAIVYAFTFAFIVQVLLFTPSVKSTPSASFTYSPTQPTAGEIVTFDASSSYDTDNTIISYEWNFGDGNNGTGKIATHAYVSVGVYNVTLKVTNNLGFFSSISETLMVYVHDVAITNIVLPAKQVYRGQIVNITVVVRNQGTAVETFNVTLFCDYPAATGTKQVSELGANADAILIFSWDTTDVVPDVGYVVEARADVVRGETDIKDNRLYSDDYILVKAQAVPSNPLLTILNQTLPYILGIAFLSSLTGVIAWKKWTTTTPIGFEFLDELTRGGIPEHHSVMISGDAGSGKSVLCQQLAYTHLQQGKPCLYVTYDSFPSEVRESMKNLQWDISAYEKNGSLKFVDCYSAMAGDVSREEHHVSQPYSLSDLGIVMSIAMKEVKQKSAKVFLDSATPLFMRLNPSEVLEFMRDRIAKVKADGGTFLFTIGKQTVSADVMSGLDEIVDCIIELSLQSGKKEDKTSRKLRIKRLRGRGFSDMWVPFKIDSQKGLVFLLPRKNALKGKKK